MKRWGIVTVGLYGLFILVLSGPLALLGGLEWSKASGFNWEWGTHELREMFTSWAYWIVLGILMVSQALLLLVPVRLAERRPKPRRGLWVPLVVASFLLALLVFVGCFSIGSAIGGDDVSKPFEWMGKQAMEWESQIPGVSGLVAALSLSDDFFTWVAVLAPLVAFWLAWGFLFHHVASQDDPESWIKRMVRWLVRGSILELLIAVPCHVVVRCRDTCCAQFATFWGIVTGLSVMLMAFGPGVFFLFAERARRLQPRLGENQSPTPGGR